MGFCFKLIKDTPLDSIESKDLLDLSSSAHSSFWIDENICGQPVKIIAEVNRRVYILGDLISTDCKNVRLDGRYLQNAKGNFILVEIKKSEITFVSSMFGLLPIFIEELDNEIWISDRINYILEANSKQRVVCKVNILERLFFNYTLTNRTLFESIRLAPSNTILSFKGSDLDEVKHTDIFKLYNPKPCKLRKSRKKLVKEFSNQIKNYLPNHGYVAAFTGGFDGRCVVAASLKNDKNFESFSFGTSAASDVKIPMQVAKNGGFRYRCIKLDLKYLDQDFKRQAEGIVMDSNGMSTISRAHYRYGALNLSKEFSFLVSGNFGSELFRAAHLDGVMTSNAFYHWLKEDLPASLNEFFTLFPELKVLEVRDYEEAYQSLRFDLDNRKESIQEIPLNAQLYFFMWEETIRNYFGPELSMQQKYIVHRSPFLDYKFFSLLQSTEFSGAYGNFRERNLTKRMKGQMFYAHYLKSTSKVLFRALTGKGYRPSDLINPLGIARIIRGKLIKRKGEVDFDPLLVNAGFDKFKQSWQEDLNKCIGDLGLSLSGDERSQHTIISIAIFLNNLLDVRKT